MVEKHRCSGKVFDGWHYLACRRVATTFEDNEWWCNSHIPSLVAQKLAERNAWYEEKWASEKVAEALHQRREQMADLFPELVETINTWVRDAGWTELPDPDRFEIPDWKKMLWRKTSSVLAKAEALMPQEEQRT